MDWFWNIEIGKFHVSTHSKSWILWFLKNFFSLTLNITFKVGRKFRALKVWFILRSYGVEGLREHIRKVNIIT